MEGMESDPSQIRTTKTQKEPVMSGEKENSCWIKPNDFSRRASCNMASERLWDLSL